MSRASLESITAKNLNYLIIVNYDNYNSNDTEVVVV